MPDITSNVSFDTVAREIRCKWDGEDKSSLTAAQDILTAHAAALKSVAGVKSVQRIVCGGCHDVSASKRARSMPGLAAHQSCASAPSSSRLLSLSTPLTLARGRRLPSRRRRRSSASSRLSRA
jgi:hypothetical protein